MSEDKSAEQKAREMLERMDMVGKTESMESCMSCNGRDALDLAAGDVIELANLIAKEKKQAKELRRRAHEIGQLRADRRWLRDNLNRMTWKVAELQKEKA